MRMGSGRGLCGVHVFRVWCWCLRTRTCKRTLRHACAHLPTCGPPVRMYMCVCCVPCAAWLLTCAMCHVCVCVCSYLLFAADPYEVVAFKVPCAEVDKTAGRLFTHCGWLGVERR